MSDVVGLPIEKSCKSMSVFEYDKLLQRQVSLILDFVELFKFFCSIIQIKLFMQKKGDRIAQIEI